MKEHKELKQFSNANNHSKVILTAGKKKVMLDEFMHSTTIHIAKSCRLWPQQKKQSITTRPII